MYTTKVFSNELEGRFDVKFYDPDAIKIKRKILKKGKQKGYEVKQLKNFGKLRKGIFQIPASEYTDRGIPFIRVACIKNLTIDVEDITYISQEWHEKEHKTKVVPGDIVISKGGTVGNIALIPHWLGESNISQDIVGFFVKNKAYSGFLTAYLTSKLGKTQINKIKTQQTHPHLTLTPLRKLSVLYNEKKAKEISKIINEAIECENNFFENINKAKKIMDDSISISVNEDDFLSYSVTSKDISSKFIPNFYYPKYLKSNKLLKKKYKTIKLKKISEIINGFEPGSKNYKKSGIPFIRTSDIVNYGIDRDSYHKLTENFFEENKQDLKSRDILFTNDGKIGFSCMLVDTDRCIIQSHIKRVRVHDDKITPEFVFIFLNTKFGLYQIYRRIFIQTTISTIEDGLNELDVPVLDGTTISSITEKCKKAFEYKEKRDILINKAVKKVEDMIEN